MVFLYLIAGFKRISKLTTDINVLRKACKRSTLVEYEKTAMGIDKVGYRDSKSLYLLPFEDWFPVLPNNTLLEFARACQMGHSAPSDFLDFENQFRGSPGRSAPPAPGIPAIEVDTTPN